MTPMQVEGKSIEECVGKCSMTEPKSIETIMQEAHTMLPALNLSHEQIMTTYGWDYQKALKLFLRQSIASVLLYTKGRMPNSAFPIVEGKSVTKKNQGYNEAIDDCHAVLDEQIREAKKLSE